MTRSILCVIASFLVVYSRHSYSQVINEIYELIKTDSRATAGLITAATSSSVLHCATTCKRTSLCKSFNVNGVGSKGAGVDCELLSVFPSLPATTVSTQQGFKIYEVKKKCGTCINGNCNVGTQYTCVCTAGYSGLTCSTNINECASNPCQNGGTCTDALNSYTCACAAGFTDNHCGTANCGTCIHGSCSGATCVCTAGYSGLTCSTNINECASNPCQNGGTCTDALNSYTCACSPGLDGPNCDIVVCPGNPPSPTMDWTGQVTITLDNQSGTKVYVTEFTTSGMHSVRHTLLSGASVSATKYKGTVYFVKTVDTSRRVKVGGTCHLVFSSAIAGDTFSITPR